MVSVACDIVFIPYFSTIVFLLGLCIGSFLNVCIYRIPRHESVIFTPSHCPNCNKNIAWYDNLPVLSWIMLSGKCRWCGEKISFRYVGIELLTAVLFEIDYLRIVCAELPLPMLLSYFVATSLFIICSFTDIKHKIIPNKVTYFVIIFSLAMAFIFPGYTRMNDRVSGLLNSFLGFAAGGGILALFSFAGSKVFKKEVLGFGDVKFVAAVGACFGIIPAVWFFVIFMGSFLGLIFGLFLIFTGKKRLGSEIQFGPFLAIAGYLWILLGPELVDFYFKTVVKIFTS